ncbi:hypothetical protein BJ742DRAFT_262593 [Cladochytrium replicatum]|nr:hypothetical protein BJ742DRAFT_262593 [Cladochytrium replicatum]
MPEMSLTMQCPKMRITAAKTRPVILTESPHLVRTRISAGIPSLLVSTANHISELGSPHSPRFQLELIPEQHLFEFITPTDSPLSFKLKYKFASLFHAITRTNTCFNRPLESNRLKIQRELPPCFQTNQRDHLHKALPWAHLNASPAPSS